MSSAIAIHKAKNVILKNVRIVGFRKGLEAIDSSLSLDNVYIERCGIGIDLIKSDAIIRNSRAVDNLIDMVVNKSRVSIIDSMVSRILEILPNGDYRVNPYRARLIAYEIINTRSERMKRSLFRKLLKYLELVGHVWIIYQIIREFSNYLRWP
jgi:hypothetical protein